MDPEPRRGAACAGWQPTPGPPPPVALRPCCAPQVPLVPSWGVRFGCASRPALGKFCTALGGGGGRIRGVPQSSDRRVGQSEEAGALAALLSPAHTSDPRAARASRPPPPRITSVASHGADCTESCQNLCQEWLARKGHGWGTYSDENRANLHSDGVFSGGPRRDGGQGHEGCPRKPICLWTPAC